MCYFEWLPLKKKRESKKKPPPNYWSVGFQLCTSKKRAKTQEKNAESTRRTWRLNLTWPEREEKTKSSDITKTQDSVLFPGSFLEWQHLGRNWPKWLRQRAKVAYLDLDLLSSTRSVFQQWHKPSSSRGIHEEEQEWHLRRLNAKHRPAAYSHLLFQLWQTGGTTGHKL